MLWLIFADMEETWKALGVSGSPWCECPNEQLAELAPHETVRSFATMRQLVTTCRDLLRQRGNVTTVKDLLVLHRLNPLHLTEWNPFLHVPFADKEAFPMDFLHGMYVNSLDPTSFDSLSLSLTFLHSDISPLHLSSAIWGL